MQKKTVRNGIGETMSSKLLTRILFVLNFLVGMICLKFLVTMLFRYPDNHGEGVVPYYFAFGTLLIIYMAIFCVFHRLPSIAVIIILLFSLPSLILCDKYNLYISYEQWIARGQPRWGQQGGLVIPDQAPDRVGEEGISKQSSIGNARHGPTGMASSVTTFRQEVDAAKTR